jgi:hypothetical protein
MRSHLQEENAVILRLTTSLSVMLASLSPVLADQFNVNLSNGETGMVFVQVYDMNTAGQNKVFDDTLTSGRQVSVYITGDSGRDGHITWAAMSSDRQKCGGEELNGLSSGNNITVRTPRSCP